MIKCLRLTIGLSLQHTAKRFAGHSKWQNIRHTKAANDIARSQMYSRLGQRIKIAIAENGNNNNPETNNALAQVLDLCRVKNMPNASIQSFLKLSKVDKSSAKTVWFDLLGPNGVFFLVNTYTDNSARTKANIRSCIKKHRLSLEGNLRGNFVHKGIIKTKPKADANVENILDACIDDAITVGAEDALEDSTESGVFLFHCDPNHVLSVKKKLIDLGYEVIEADDYYMPLKFVSLTDDETVEDLEKAIEKLNALPEVVKIYDNIE
ncbi:translational activator of cytochrome c oxidase 1 [Nilaparvata lugens]|uniref:translational activator of cytochrome c oxidase 1 n=1 Tax=Nilaparvata lugens TaxID=108931 RepID=UPI000B981FE7|nr:translational activator of cytochrome c oxidase 1 [Nilaparvata lugens]